MTARRDELVHEARNAVDRALARRRRAGIGVLAAGLTTVLLAPAARAATLVDDPSSDTTATTATTPDDGTTPTTGTDPFDAGSDPVPTDQVSGDSTTTETADTTPTTAAAAQTGGRGDSAFPTEHVKASGDGVRAASIGEFVDGNHVNWSMDMDVTSTLTDSYSVGEASGGFDEASFTASSGVTTTDGGTTQTELDDAFDGYGGLCLDLDADNGDVDCATENGDTLYNQLGAPPGTECSGREVVFPTLDIDDSGVTVFRKVYVPSDDSFARWLNVVSNPTGSTQTVRLTTANNVGSDDDTVITATSSGDQTATDGDLWVATFQDFSGSTSSDPRLGHVLGGPGAAVAPTNVTFADGDDLPFWSYDLTLAPGESRIVATYAVVQTSQAAAASQSASLSAGTHAHQWACMTDAERAQVANWANRAVSDPGTNDPAPAPTASFQTGASTVLEGNTDTITILRSGNAQEARTFVLTVGGTATPGADYTGPSSLSVAFGAGETSKTVSIAALLDNVSDGGETVVLTLTDPDSPIDPEGAPPTTVCGGEGCVEGLGDDPEVVADALGVLTSHTVTIQDVAPATTTSTTAAVRGTALPRTGTEVGDLLQLAGGGVAAGGALVYARGSFWSRRRWRAARHRSRQ